MTLDEIQHRVAALERALAAAERRAATVIEAAADAEREAAPAAAPRPFMAVP